MIVFDRPFIANPDWVERIRNSWHLPPEAAMDAWYSQQEAGYIDCPPIPDRAEAEHAMAPWV